MTARKHTVSVIFVRDDLVSRVIKGKLIVFPVHDVGVCNMYCHSVLELSWFLS